MNYYLFYEKFGVLRLASNYGFIKNVKLKKKKQETDHLHPSFLANILKILITIEYFYRN